MKNFNLKSIIPIATGIVIFIVLTFAYFTPLLKGKVIVQSDMVQNAGMAREIVDFRKQYNEETLWTNSMFGGMPAYHISIKYPANKLPEVRNAFMLWLPFPANVVFAYMLGFFILLLVLKVDKWLSIIGAIGFGFSAFFFLIIDAGHNTQALAIAFMAPVFAGVILVCRGKYLLGGALTSLFMAIELYCSHPQISYYLIIFLTIYVIYEWIHRIRQKKYDAIFKSLLVFIIAAVFSLGCNITNLWNTYEYAKKTIRGPSELTSDKKNKTSGLDIDYATQWSMGKSETLTLLIPGFKGRSSSIMMSENKKVLKEVDPQMRESIANFPQYWGDQPFTSSPYTGAIIVFLFILGLFIVEGRLKWALLTITILSISLSWGKNMLWLTELFLHYFPGYNKFRAVSMILVLAEVAIPILGVLALDKLLKTPNAFKQKIKLAFSDKQITIEKAFLISFILTGGLSLLFFIMPSLISFSSINDNAIYDQISKSNGAEVAQHFMDNVELARIAIFKSEAIRSFLFITLGALTIWLYAKSKLNKSLLILILGILIIVDLSSVDKSYLSEKNFANKKESKTPFVETLADKAILQDKDPDYRVLDLADPQGPFNSARSAYFHKSIGGYHAAKLRRYQELIENQINKNIQNISNTFKSTPTDSSLNAMFAAQGVLNMLNMRYLIYNADAPPLQNRYALGNAWFVKDIKMVKNADEELQTIGEINPSTTVVIDERYKKDIADFNLKFDPTATIKLTSYKPNDLTYQSKATSEQLAVFSEIYYSDGWNAYIDGKIAPYFSANWVLRAMRIPAGEHIIEFKFEPARYATGEKISLVSCILLFIGVIVSLFYSWKQRKNCDIKE
ncbi:MAG: YfhO family protein [Bacteroidia bacterium]